jgi:hypothetical protein
MRKLQAAWAAGVVALALFAATAHAQEREVTLAGVAFSGTHDTIAQRFPHTQRYVKSLESAGTSAFKQVLASVQQVRPEHLAVTANPIQDLKGRDQALVVSLVLNSETVSVERFGEVRKLFVLVRGQALFFDFKSMTVVRAYPISFAYIDNFRKDPGEGEIAARVKAVYEGVGGRPGLFGRFAQALGTAKVPHQTPRFLQVAQVTLAPEMVEMLPDYLKSSSHVYETWAADMVGEAISSRVGVPIIPYAKGYAIGNVMSMQVMDGDVFNLKLPTPDYAIEVDLKGLRKVKYSESAAGASFVYGSLADIRIQEPLSRTFYMNTPLKNAEVKVVPASQTHVDDFPAFTDALNGMFAKLADAMAGKGNTWAKAAAAAPDIEAQISKTKELMNLCK